MEQPRHHTRSYWETDTPAPLAHPPLAGDFECDVAVVGAGFTGLTAALLIKRAGLRVALLEAREDVALGESGRTTAHLTEVLDERYRRLITDFGREGARLASRAQRDAITWIERIVAVEGIECGFRRVPAFLYTEHERDVTKLREELTAMRKAGLAARLTREVPVRFPVRAGIRVEAQAELHPRDYLRGLAERIPGGGSRIFLRSPALEVVDGDPCIVRTDVGRVRAGQVVVATDSPVSHRFSLHPKLSSRRTYAIAFPSPGPLIAAGLYWDLVDPYHYTRLHRGHLIVGGADHKVGANVDTRSGTQALLRYSRDRFGTVTPDHAWSGQVVETADGLPYIGRAPFSEGVFVATGYAGNGTTWGTFAGLMLRDLVRGRPSAWSDLLAPSRLNLRASAPTLMQENAEVAACYFGDRVLPSETRSLRELGPGEGRIVTVNGRRLAAYRDERGEVRTVSPVCTHLGCHVRFNAFERSWDCPCHGSRFANDGRVLHGPATTALAPVAADEPRDVPDEDTDETVTPRRRRRAA